MRSCLCGVELPSPLLQSLATSFPMWKCDAEAFLPRQSASDNVSSGRSFMILLLTSKTNIVMKF